MIKKLKGKTFFTTLVVLVLTTVLATPLSVHAAFTEEATVVGNGVRLRKKPVNGTILELMYYGEKIYIDPAAPSEHSAWIYVQRDKTKTVGWMEWSYFEHH